MSATKWLDLFGLALAAVAVGTVGLKNYGGGEHGQLLNASYDPTREVYKEINAEFVAQYERDAGHRLSIEQSHGGSSRQARAVADGLAADVVTLALPSDIEGLSKGGLIAPDWKNRFPHQSQPYFSTIVFVVRKENPKRIKDWPDLVGPDVEVVTPDPNTSGNGKLSVLAAWGSVIHRGGSEDDARDFLVKLYQHVAVLGQGARDSATTFVLAKEGDVHLTWENEALREVADSKGELEVVYPPVSILAEPSVTWVDLNVRKHASAAAAKAYLAYLFTDAAQEIFAKHGYRPINRVILKRHQDRLPDIELFPVTLVAKDWADAQARFFGDSGIFEIIHTTQTK
ncbi:MAG: sulfate ABC transporter substrate-binding protein [Verrucomicrobia bacterium]|nr:sulfate ABC transporter substrate-binding protein [Verrucomicrobiota bacterium]